MYSYRPGCSHTTLAVLSSVFPGCVDFFFFFRIFLLSFSAPRAAQNLSRRADWTLEWYNRKPRRASNFSFIRFPPPRSSPNWYALSGERLCFPAAAAAAAAAAASPWIWPIMLPRGGEQRALQTQRVWESGGVPRRGSRQRWRRWAHTSESHLHHHRRASRRRYLFLFFFWAFSFFFFFFTVACGAFKDW